MTNVVKLCSIKKGIDKKLYINIISYYVYRHYRQGTERRQHNYQVLTFLRKNNNYIILNT